VALITRGLAEMMRLGVALGAERETFMGLAGPRRPRAHLYRRPVAQPSLRPGIAAGKSAEQAQAEIGQVVEGVLAARAVHDVARRHGVEMPISEQVLPRALRGHAGPQGVYALMGRTVKSEIY